MKVWALMTERQDIIRCGPNDSFVNLLCCKDMSFRELHKTERGQKKEKTAKREKKFNVYLQKPHNNSHFDLSESI